MSGDVLYSSILFWNATRILAEGGVLPQTELPAWFLE